MAQHTTLERIPETVLTFRPFIDYLKERRTEIDCHKSRFFNFVIEQFENNPELLKSIDLDDVKNYEQHLQLIYSTVSPIIENEESHGWALSLPLRPVIFYSTNAYFNLVTNAATGGIRKSILSKSPRDLRRNQLEFTYSLVLEKLYNFSSVFNRDIIHSLDDEHTGLTSYVKLSLDTRFIEIHTTQPLPDLRLEDLRLGTFDPDESLSLMEKKLPLDMFRL